jgi:hypothetical protein
MPEFASTNSRREGEITLLKFETAVVSKESAEDASAARMRCVLVTSSLKKLADRREAPHLLSHRVQGSPLPRKCETTVVSH